jgi:uncharacterized membrane protein YkoI
VHPQKEITMESVVPNRKTLLALTAAALFLAAPAVHRSAAAPPPPPGVRLALLTDDDDDKKGPEKVHKKDADDEKEDKDDDGDKKEKKEKKEVEQAVPMDMVPTAVLDAVKKEVPGGTITGAELEAKKGKIMYAFDVKAADVAYEVKITVDGKFYSKKVDDDQDDKDDKPPAGAEK